MEGISVSCALSVAAMALSASYVYVFLLVVSIQLAGSMLLVGSIHVHVCYAQPSMECQRQCLGSDVLLAALALNI